MESEKLIKSFCEDFCGGESDITEKPGIEKSQSRQYKDILMQNVKKERKVTERMFLILKEMESFSQAKTNMFIPTRDGISKALTKIEELRKISHWKKRYLVSF